MKLRYLFFLCVCAAVLVGCHTREVRETATVVPMTMRPTAQTDNILGKVKCTVEKKYMNLGYLDSTVLYAIHYQYFTKDGWLTDDVILNDVEDTVFHTHVTYSADGKMVRSDTYDSTGTLSEHVVYEVDAHGYRTKESVYQGDSLVREMLYQNDAYGNVLKTTVRTAYDIVMTYSYDASQPGLPVRIDEVGPDGTTFMYITIDYNQRGDVVNRRAFSGGGQEAENSHTQYGDKGELLKQTHQVTLKNLQKQDVSTFENHDKFGNWQKQVTKRQGVPYFEIERTIQYY